MTNKNIKDYNYSYTYSYTYMDLSKIFNCATILNLIGMGLIFSPPDFLAPYYSDYSIDELNKLVSDCAINKESIFKLKTERYLNFKNNVNSFYQHIELAKEIVLKLWDKDEISFEIELIKTYTDKLEGVFKHLELKYERNKDGN